MVDVLASLVPPVPLRKLFESDRFVRLDMLERYYDGKQYDHRAYDWSGAFRGFGDEIAGQVLPGYYVPLAQRRPSARYDIAKVIVNRLSSFLFDEAVRPTLSIAGDYDAEDFARELARESRLWSKLRQARQNGGTTGTAILSWCIKAGKPSISVHNPKHVKVLDWDDEDDLRPRVVLKAYSYESEILDGEESKTVVLWSLRLWTDTEEFRWRAVPDEFAKDGRWRLLQPDRYVRHDFGLCPVYWIQNHPDDEEWDGVADFAGAEDLIDELNQTLSQSVRGTKANVDPTLVIHADEVAPGRNDSGKVVSKGSGNVIWSKDGAEYLELSGQAVDAGLKTVDALEVRICDQCGIVRTSAEKLSGAAQSARALEILYAPTLATAGVLREQYGIHGAIPILRDMLEVARALENAPPIELEDGTKVRRGFMLDPRLEAEELEDEDEDEEEAGEEPGEDLEEPEVPIMVEVERTPGTSSALELVWPPYFAPTWTDRKEAVEAAKAANGDKPVISHRTSVAAVASLFGVADVDEEIAQIEREGQEAAKRAMEAFGGDPTAGADAFGENDEGDEGGDEDEGDEGGAGE